MAFRAREVFGTFEKRAPDLGCYTVKCLEILAHIELLYNLRVNKVFTSLHFTSLHFTSHSQYRCTVGSTVIRANERDYSLNCSTRGPITF